MVNSDLWELVVAAVTLTVDLPTSCLLASENSSCVSSDCATRCLSVGTAIGLVLGGGGSRVSWDGGSIGEPLSWLASQPRAWSRMRMRGKPGSAPSALQTWEQSLFFFGKQQNGNSLCSGPRAHSPLRQTPGGKHGRGPLYNIVPPKPVSNFPQWNLHIG